MKLAFCLAFLFALVTVTQGRAEDYCVYESSKGELVMSNKKLPRGSKIIRQRSFPETTDSEVSQGQQPNDPQPTGQAEGLAKPSKGT